MAGLKRVLLGLACALALHFPLAAQAKLLVVNTGDELFEVAELPLQLKHEMQDGYKIGYICRHFGLFWADFYTWNCRLVAVDMAHETYAHLPAEMVDGWHQQHPWKNAKRSLWNQYGAVPVSLLVLTILYGSIKCFIRKKKATHQHERTLDQ